MTLERMAKQYTTHIQLKNPENIAKKQPVLEIAYQNILFNEIEWLDMIWEVQKGADISEYCERLYKSAGGGKVCRNKKIALQYAELYLCIFMEDINRRILMNAFNYFMKTLIAGLFFGWLTIPVMAIHWLLIDRKA